MRWLDLPRVPEAEAMDEAEEVSAYASATGEQYLNKLDDTLVDQFIRLGARQGPPRGRLLDVGCGPGGIALKIARRCPSLEVVGVDRASRMVASARAEAAAGGLGSRAAFSVGDGNSLPFPAASFNYLLSNSVLHHLENPVAVFNEMRRVARPGASILIRDLRRPPRLLYPFHIRWHGRYYSGVMKGLYVRSVRAAYTPAELAAMLARSKLAGARIFELGGTHLGFICQIPG